MAVGTILAVLMLRSEVYFCLFAFAYFDNCG